MSLPFYLPYRASAEEAGTKQKAGNCTAPSGPESYSLLAEWSSQLVKNGAEESGTNSDTRPQDSQCLLAFNDPDTAGW